MQDKFDIISGKLLDIEFQRSAAKIAMGTSLALLAITALNLKNRQAVKLHTVSGVALIGFSVWHASLYGTKYAKFLNEQSKKKAKKDI